MKCNELKAYKGDVTIPVYGTIADAEVYLKKDADKALAEKDKEIAELKQKLGAVNELVKESKELLKESQKMHKRCADGATKKICHQKFKRCLAMARWCRESLRLMRTYEVTEDFWNLEPGQDAEYFCKKGDFYSKWRKRWLQLADKFKEAK